MKRNSRYRGIVVAANSLEEAQERYRAVASGEGYALRSQDGSFVVSTAQVEGQQLMNPVDGEEMVTAPEEFKHTAVASAKPGDEADVFYAICSSGCGSHLLVDDEQMLAKCPACASDLQQLEDTDLKTKKQEVILAFASSQEGVTDAYRGILNGSVKTFATECDGVMVVSNKPLQYDVYRGVAAAQSEEDYESQAVTALASAQDGGTVDAHYFTTASEAGDVMHVLCSDDSPLFCPETSMGLIEPSNFAAASDDDESDEDDEDEDFEDDDEDESEEDDSDEESDEDDEDEDDELSLSLASSGVENKRGGVFRKEKKMVSVAASFVAIAGDKMSPENVELAFAGSIKGDQTWLAFYDGLPFAKATASSTKKKDIFSDSTFARAFKALASEHGVATALEEMGFEEIKPTVQVADYVQAEIQSAVEAKASEIREEAERDTNELSSRYEAALASAAQGINRGFFPALQNPIIAALASSLEAVGLRGAEQIVANAFAEHGDAYNKMLIAKATDITGYELEVQNQLAQAITQTSHVATASAVVVGRPAKIDEQPSQKTVATASNNQSGGDFMSRLQSLTFGQRR